MRQCNTPTLALAIAIVALGVVTALKAAPPDEDD